MVGEMRKDHKRNKNAVARVAARVAAARVAAARVVSKSINEETDDCWRM